MTRASLAGALALVVAALVAGCGGADEPQPQTPQGAVPASDPGPVHVHGLGINPADGALLIATHTGLFRAAPSQDVARRVGDSHQDTMGFTVVGPDRFLGSGHPDLRTRQPPYLGLVESTDAGRSWHPVSLHGKADFHVLEAAGRRVVGYGSDFRTRRQQLLVSDDAGETWSARRPPAPLIDLALDPRDPDVWVASTGEGLVRTTDAGRSWTRLPGPAGLLAWHEPRRLFAVGSGGEVTVSPDGGRTWNRAGEIGGQPAALEAEPDALYAALHDGVIRMSRDDGRTWTVRSRPQATGG